MLSWQTRTPLFYLPLAYAGPVPLPRQKPGTTLRLIAFGFIGGNRRIASVIEALAGLRDKDWRFDLYGVLEAPDAVEAQAAELGVADRVHQHGFVSEAELTAALAQADLALNLRFPSMGEASGSQLRIWDATLPSLVTRVGWYATLPEDAVFFVEPEREVEMIRSYVTALRQDPEPFRLAGLRGRALVQERHTPAHYAASLMEIVRQAECLHARRLATDLSRAAAQALKEMTDLTGVAQCAGVVAAAVHDLTGQKADPAPGS